MKSFIIAIFIIFTLTGVYCYASSNDSSDIIKKGLLGAGSGAVGGLASGGKGGDIWKGALAGAGVNVIGDALLDSISGEHVEEQSRVPAESQDAYGQG